MSDFVHLPFAKRSWRHCELLEVFPARGIRIMDLGSGSSPFRGRSIDVVETVDFSSEADYKIDVVRDWPFTNESFDLVYASHVIEHFYPRDRDLVVNRIWRVLRPGGLFFFRVPHKSSIQATGWEHHTVYGLNAAMSLCHGANPALPKFEAVSFGASRINVYGFYEARRFSIDSVLNISHNLTEKLISRLLYGGVSEVQVLLRRPFQASSGRGHDPGERSHIRGASLSRHRWPAISGAGRGVETST